MRKGSRHIPREYIKIDKVAEGRYIQSIYFTYKPDMNWIAVNNISVKKLECDSNGK